LHQTRLRQVLKYKTNCSNTKPLDPKEEAMPVSATKQTQEVKSLGGYMPSQNQLKNLYRTMYDRAVKDHTAQKLARPPRGAEAMEGLDLNPPNVLGATKTAYVIKGNLYVKTAIVSPTAKPTWEKVGPIPYF
jgi:hypothetical protein